VHRWNNGIDLFFDLIVEYSELYRIVIEIEYGSKIFIVVFVVISPSRIAEYIVCMYFKYIRCYLAK
jgi:hypothetical protein